MASLSSYIYDKRWPVHLSTKTDFFILSCFDKTYPWKLLLNYDNAISMKITFSALCLNLYHIDRKLNFSYIGPPRIWCNTLLIILKNILIYISCFFETDLTWISWKTFWIIPDVFFIHYISFHLTGVRPTVNVIIFWVVIGTITSLSLQIWKPKNIVLFVKGSLQSHS